MRLTFLLSILIFACSCSPKMGITSLVEKTNNPVYSSETESRIKRVINNLQVETVFEGSFKNKTLTEQMAYYHTPGLVLP